MTDKLQEYAVRVDTFVVAVVGVEHVEGFDYHRVETGELFRTLDDGSVNQYREDESPAAEMSARSVTVDGVEIDKLLAGDCPSHCDTDGQRNHGYRGRAIDGQ